MKILVLNCGSSSIKYKLFDMTTKEVIAQGGIEKIGLKGSFLKLTLPNGEKKILEKDIPEHTVGVEFILNTLINPEYGAIKSLDEINAVGHRMVHGGERFSESVLLNKEVLEAFAACNDLAPLHNPANLKGVNAVSAILPNIPQVGVFDTAFHQTMPDYAYMYAIPHELYEKYGVRRYGFHGTSHRYVSKRVCEFLGVNPVGQKIITCHIGNGGSIAAIKDGKCMDTTMGLTPLVGEMYARHDYRTSARLFQNALVLNSVVGILLFVVLQVFGQCLGLMGQSEEVVAEAAPYYNYLAWSIIPFMIFAAFKQFLEGVGNTMTGMVVVLTANVINILFNYLLIYGHGGFPAMGAAGAGLATLISRICMPLFVLIYFIRVPSLRRYFRFFT